MLDLRYSSAAQRDLGEIANYLEQQAGTTVATKVLGRIRRQALTLRRDAHRYRERVELGEGRRALLVGAYIVFNRIEADTVFIQRILHSARQIEPRLFEE